METDARNYAKTVHVGQVYLAVTEGAKMTPRFIPANWALNAPKDMAYERNACGALMT